MRCITPDPIPQVLGTWIGFSVAPIPTRPHRHPGRFSLLQKGKGPWADDQKINDSTTGNTILSLGRKY